MLQLSSRERERERERELRELEDEEEIYERRKLERKMREKEAAYQEVKGGLHTKKQEGGCIPRGKEGEAAYRGVKRGGLHTKR